MENPKYLIIIALIDGQNFTVPDGAPDKVEATVFAEARFGNESILRSDPVKLTNSNPEFVTELAWQIDKRSLHQLRVERKAIKLQVFLQTRERKKSFQRQQQHQHQLNNDGQSMSNGCKYSSANSNGETHKVELIGYTILDLRSAQPKEHTNYKWYPLLNPKFRKSSYNRPEIQLAVTMSRSDEDDGSNQEDSTNQFSSISTLPEVDASMDSFNNGDREYVRKDLLPNTTREGGSSVQNSDGSTKLYTTCLDTSLKNNPSARRQSSPRDDEIIDNDIIIRSKDGLVHIYDAKHPHKFTIDDCDEHYRLMITIPFTSYLNSLVKYHGEKYHFSACLFGITLRTEQFQDLTSLKPKRMIFKLQTTHAGVLATYFELKSNLDIKLFRSSDGGDECIGLATIQLNQLCSLDTTCRTIEGIFALQSVNNETELEYSLPVENPSIGVSVILEKSDPSQNYEYPDATSECSDRNNAAEQEFSCYQNDYYFKLKNSHQLTMENSKISDILLPNDDDQKIVGGETKYQDNVLIGDPDVDGPTHDDHHYCFTIDLKKFSYTSSQWLIPTLRELVIRYSYPFFGYKDTITTDASIPISPTSSIIVSGFCEFNFATTVQPLLTALSELPLDLEILAADETRLRELDGGVSSEQMVATCSVNLAELLELDRSNIDLSLLQTVSKTTSVPIFALNGTEIGQLQLSLCLKDLGPQVQKIETEVDDVAPTNSLQDRPINLQDNPSNILKELRRVDIFIDETQKNFESWKKEKFSQVLDECLSRDDERFKRLVQRLETKEAKRDQEFKKKMDDLKALERKFKNSLSCVESLEKMLVDSLEHLKANRTSLEDRLDMMELKISQITMCNGTASKKCINDGLASPHRTSLTSGPRIEKLRMQPQRSFDDNLLKTGNGLPKQIVAPTSYPSLATRNASDKNGPRRPSVRAVAGSPLTGDSGGQVPVATRSTSLVRRPSEGSTAVTRIVKRNSGAGPGTVVNEINSRVRSNSAKFNLSKENQEKLANLRKEKAELLKRGCKATDDLIREINSLIDKLAC